MGDYFGSIDMRTCIKTKARTWLFSLSLLGACSTPFDGQNLLMAPRGRTFNAQGEYIIGLNDKLTIRVIGNTDLAGDYTVSQNGTISMPLIGAEKAAGFSEKEFSKILTKRYETYFKTPTVSVGVSGYDSYRVFITGEVRKPGAYSFQEKTTIMQGLATAGGLGDFAKGTIVLHRIGKTGQVEKFIGEYSKILSGDGKLSGFILERGDVIHVY